MQAAILNKDMKNLRNTDPRVVGRRILDARTAHGYSQSKLAKICGFSITALSNWENGRQRPALESAEKIIDLFDLTLDYLMLGKAETLKHSVFLHLRQMARKS